MFKSFITHEFNQEISVYWEFWHLIYVLVWSVCKELETLAYRKQVWFLLRFGLYKMYSWCPCPVSHFYIFLFFSCIIEHENKNICLKNIHFGKVYVRQVHPSIVCYLLPRHFFSTLFWLSLLACCQLQCQIFGCPVQTLVCGPACVYQWQCVKVEEWLQDDKIFFTEEVHHTKS